MKRLAIPLSITALALAACTVQPPVSIANPNTAPVVSQNLPYASGYGRVESVREAPQSSVSGGTATGASNRNLRLGLRMDDGTLQYIDTDSDQYPKGTRVLLTSDHQIKKMEYGK